MSETTFALTMKNASIEDILQLRRIIAPRMFDHSSSFASAQYKRRLVQIDVELATR